jgi:chondroitin AC lyase
MHWIFQLGVSAAVLVSCSLPLSGSDLALIESRTLARLVESPPSAGTVTTWMAQQAPDGSWPDVDYADRSRTDWVPATHSARMRDIAKAYAAPAGVHSGDPAVLASATAAFDFWVVADPVSDNWWYNEINTPLVLGEMLVLLKSELAGPRMAAGSAMVARAYVARTVNSGTNTGQNRVDRAIPGILRGIANSDSALVTESYLAIADTLKITTGEGIQPDYSFHQHGAQLYNRGYGSEFGRSVSRWLNLASGTGFAFSPPKSRLLADLMLDGDQWFIRGRYFDFTAQGRSVSRQGASIGASAFRSGVGEMTASASPYRSGELQEFDDRLDAAFVAEAAAPELALSGNRYFHRSDILCHHRPGFYASVKMSSKRTREPESGNGEGLKNLHLGDGVCLLVRRGDEYFDLPPVWDWRKLPGTTIEQGTYSLKPTVDWGVAGTRTHVGGVSDGVHGSAAFDYAKRNVSARKSWFFLGDEIVALGSAIHAPAATSPVLTTLNQCRLAGGVLWSDGGDAQPLAAGQQLSPPGLRWVHHDGVGYLFPDGAASNLTVSTLAGSGSWASINDRYSSAVVSADLFSLWIDHGLAPEGGSYAYVMLPGVTPEQLAERADQPGIEVLANTPEVHAVKHEALGLTGIHTWVAGAPAVDDIRVQQAACVMVRRHAAGVDLHVSDPTMENPGLIEVDLPDREARLVAADPGVSLSRRSGFLRVSISVAGSGGRTFRVSLRTDGVSLGLVPIDVAADVSVSEESPALAAGQEPALVVSGQPGGNHEALMRFDLSALSSPPLAAELRIHPVAAAGGLRHRLSRVVPDVWQEETLTWLTRPAISKPVATWTPLAGQAQRLVASDAVAEAFASGGPLEFSMHDLDEGTAAGEYASREHPDENIRPQLWVAVPHDHTVGLSLSRPIITEGGGVSSVLSVFRSGDVSGPLELSLTASGTALEGGHLAGLPASLVIPAGERIVEIELVAVDNTEVNPSRWVEIALAASPAPWLLAPDHSVKLVILDDDTEPFRRFDTFDVGDPPTTGDDAQDPDDITWTRTPVSGTFNVSAPDVAFDGTRALHFAPGAGFGKLFGQLPVLPLSVPGQSYRLAFRAKYQTQPAANSGGFRFGFFNSKGDGYFIYQGTGSNSAFSALRDFGGDNGFSSGSTTGALPWVGSGTATGFGSAGVRDFDFKLTRTADGGVRVEAAVDSDLDGIPDYSLVGTDSASLLDDISRVVISNGNITTAFRVDDVLVENDANRPPWFVRDPIRPPRVRVGREMVFDLGGEVFDPDAGGELAFEVAGLPSWLEIGPDGRLVGTPGAGDAGEIRMDVGVIDTGGLTARADLIVHVDPQPAYLQWAAANGVDPNEPDSLAAFVFGGEPGGSGTGRPRMFRTHDGQALLLAWLPAGAVFEPDGAGLSATVDGVRIRVECGGDLASWLLPVRELGAPDIPDQPPAGWELRAFAPEGNPEKAFLRFALDFQDE